MFTGLIQAVGKVIKYDGKRLWVHTPFRALTSGESIALDGVCLTVAASKGREAAFDVGPETKRITTLGSMKPGHAVNLERALRVGDALGGHWVSGHVEKVGKIKGIRRSSQGAWYTFQIPQTLVRYVIPKGSIALDGISLTVARKRGRCVEVMLIPHTLSHTSLAQKKIGDAVNVETDMLGKYALRRRSGNP